ncbi:MAG: PH domain-containing protein [Patescibacteria group bacterium]|nr:PH domain-containing protein [Patescibacteria group bacterium]
MNVTDSIRLKEGEEVVAVVRRTPIVHLPRLAAALLLISAPFFFMVPLFGMRWRWLGVTVFAASIALGLYLALRGFVIWFWNAFIITTRRIVDVDQRGLFERAVSEATYDKVQDVSYHVKGVWQMLLGYGTLFVQTAGAQATLELDGVRRPKDIHHVISETMAKNLALEENGRSRRVYSLLDAAAGLSEAEARAFLVELQGAVNQKEPPPQVDEASVAGIMRDDADGEAVEEE